MSQLSIRRREFLAACCSGVAAGCLGFGSDRFEPGTILYKNEGRSEPLSDGFLASPRTDWPEFQYNARNHGFNPDVSSGPGRRVQVKWVYDTVPGDYNPDVNSEVILGEAALSDGKVFIARREFFDDPVHQPSKLYVLDARTAREIWQTTLPFEVRTSPTMADRYVFIGGDSHAICVDRINREIEWAREFRNRPEWEEYDRKYATGPPAVGEGRVFFGTVNGYFYAFELETGRELWSYKATELPDNSEPADDANLSVFDGPAAVVDGMVYIGNWNGFVYCFDAETGKVIWRNESLGRGGVQPGPTVVGDTLYANDHVDLVALDRHDGSLQWRFSEDPGRTCESLVYADDTIYVPSGPALESLSTIALDPSDRSIGWRFRGRPQASASTGPELLYVPMVGNLVAIDRELGDVVWELVTDSVIAGPPIITNEAVITIDEKGRVYGIGPESE